MNKVCILGRLTADPKLAQTKNGKPYCKFTLAVDKWGKDSGTNFFNCIAWDKRGETIAQYVKKGQQLPIVGRLDQSTYEKNGEKQSFVSIIVDEFDFPPKTKEATPSEQAGLDFGSAEMRGEEIPLDSIPF